MVNKTTQACYSSGTAGEVEKLLFELWPQHLEVAKASERRSEREVWMQWGDCLKLKYTAEKAGDKGGKRTSKGGKKECAAVQRER